MGARELCRTCDMFASCIVRRLAEARRDAETTAVIKIQAHARGFLVRRRLLHLGYVPSLADVCLVCRRVALLSSQACLLVRAEMARLTAEPHALAGKRR